METWYFRVFLLSILEIYLISTYLFYFMPLLFKFYLQKHILWRDSEDKCCMCNLTPASSSKQHHYVIITLIITFSTVVTIVSKANSRNLNQVDNLLTAAHQKNLSSKTGQLVTSVKQLWDRYRNFRGLRETWEKSMHFYSLKEHQKSYLYNQTAWKAVAKLKAGIKIFRV